MNASSVCWPLKASQSILASSRGRLQSSTAPRRSSARLMAAYITTKLRQARAQPKIYRMIQERCLFCDSYPVRTFTDVRLDCILTVLVILISSRFRFELDGRTNPETCPRRCLSQGGARTVGAQEMDFIRSQRDSYLGRLPRQWLKSLSDSNRSCRASFQVQLPKP